jgi:hypothetical protein
LFLDLVELLSQLFELLALRFDLLPLLLDQLAQLRVRIAGLRQSACTQHKPTGEPQVSPPPLSHPCLIALSSWRVLGFGAAGLRVRRRVV